MKQNLLDVLVIGTGLSSLIFSDTYLERKNKKLNIISFNNNNKKTSTVNKHIFKFLPPQMQGREKVVNDFFFFNNIKLKKNCNIYGSLEFGGLSNYWGLQLDSNLKQDLSHLKKKTKEDIEKNFFEIIKKFKLIGKLKKKNYENQIKDNFFLKENAYDNNRDVILERPILGYKKIQNKKFLSKIDEYKNKLTPNLVYKNILKKKKIIFHNYFVEKILDYRKNILVVCSNGEKKKNFITKKLVLGCGTIATTKLIIDYLKIEKEVKIFHHPRLFSLYFLKRKWKNDMDFQPSTIHLKLKKKPNLFTSDFRPGNKVIIDALVKFKLFLKPFKFLLYIFKEYFLFSNMFLSSDYSNLFLQKKLDNFIIYSKQKNIIKIFKKNSKLVYNFLRKTKKIFPFFINYFPGFGSDFHYFGTIPMAGKGVLSANENCQLRKNKKIYLIDGTVINFKTNKYPLGVILANSRRIGKKF